MPVSLKFDFFSLFILYISQNMYVKELYFEFVFSFIWVVPFAQCKLTPILFLDHNFLASEYRTRFTGNIVAYTFLCFVTRPGAYVFQVAMSSHILLLLFLGTCQQSLLYAQWTILCFKQREDKNKRALTLSWVIFTKQDLSHLCQNQVPLTSY